MVRKVIEITTKHKIIILAVVLFSMCLSCEKDKNFEAGIYMYEGQQLFNVIPNAVCDVDGNTYDAVKIGGQVWIICAEKSTN